MTMIWSREQKNGFLFLTETPNKLLSEKVGNNFKYYQSIDMADSLEEVPVKGFAGTFDGQGHKIIGLSDIGYIPEAFVYASSTDVLNGYTFGLFGKVKGGATVKNLTLRMFKSWDTTLT